MRLCLGPTNRTGSIILGAIGLSVGCFTGCPCTELIVKKTLICTVCGREAALAAVRAWPGGLQVGGGISLENAAPFLDAGASHVIVTSYVFRDGRLDSDRLEKLVRIGCGKSVTYLGCIL